MRRATTLGDPITKGVTFRLPTPGDGVKEREERELSWAHIDEDGSSVYGLTFYRVRLQFHLSSITANYKYHIEGFWRVQSSHDSNSSRQVVDEMWSRLNCY